MKGKRQLVHPPGKRRVHSGIPGLLLLVALSALSATGWTAEEPLALLESLSERSYTELVDSQANLDERGFRVPTGAMRKVRGVWAPEESERLDGTRSVFTWRILDAYPAGELLEEMTSALLALDGSRVLYECEARACGSSAQWANRVFSQRVLYGREASQRYRVIAIQSVEAAYRVMLYASARTADRQYLHAELLLLAADPGESNP